MSAAPPRRSEFDLIARLFAPLTKEAPGALKLLDDAAFLKVTPAHELAITTDALIAGVHFRADDPPHLVARKALRVNLSDLAAKGARPVGFLQTLTLSDAVTDSYLEGYASGLAADIAAYHFPLLGGDTTTGPGPFSIAITALGEVAAGKALLRSGARAGDVLFVTGTIGDGALGLECLSGVLDAGSNRDALIDRYHLPQPRMDTGRALVGIASACIDISDGLVADVGHICKASGIGATIDRGAIPLSAGASDAVTRDEKWWDKILGGGDDYELAFTVPPSQIAAIAALARTSGVALTGIGRMTAEAGVTVLADGKPVSVRVAGYRHR